MPILSPPPQPSKETGNAKHEGHFSMAHHNRPLPLKEAKATSFVGQKALQDQPSWHEKMQLLLNAMYLWQASNTTTAALYQQTRLAGQQGNYKEVERLTRAFIQAACPHQPTPRRHAEETRQDIERRLDDVRRRASLYDAAQWNAQTPAKLARQILNTRDVSLLPILADALEEAGVVDPLSLTRLRNPGGIVDLDDSNCLTRQWLQHIASSGGKSLPRQQNKAMDPIAKAHSILQGARPQFVQMADHAFQNKNWGPLRDWYTELLDKAGYPGEDIDKEALFSIGWLRSICERSLEGYGPPSNPNRLRALGLWVDACINDIITHMEDYYRQHKQKSLPNTKAYDPAQWAKSILQAQRSQFIAATQYAYQHNQWGMLTDWLSELLEKAHWQLTDSHREALDITDWLRGVINAHRIDPPEVIMKRGIPQWVDAEIADLLFDIGQGGRKEEGGIDYHGKALKGQRIKAVDPRRRRHDTARSILRAERDHYVAAARHAYETNNWGVLADWLSELLERAGWEYSDPHPKAVESVIWLQQMIHDHHGSREETLQSLQWWVDNDIAELTHAIIDGQPPSSRKSLPGIKTKAGNWFEECPRDEAGRCEPKGSKDESGKKKQEKVPAQPKQPSKPPNQLSIFNTPVYQGSKAKVHVVAPKGIKGAKIHKQVDENIKDLLGKDYNLQDMASMVGAPHDAHVAVQPYGDSISVVYHNDDLEANGGLYKRDDDERPLLNYEINNFDVVPPSRGTGIASEVFSNQVQWCSANHLNSIRLTAGGHDGSEMVGYYAWPRLGFNAPTSIFPPLLKRRFDLGPYAASKTILEVLETPEGRQWWKEHGSTFDATFDLDPASWSVRVLRAYIEERRLRKGKKSIEPPVLRKPVSNKKSKHPEMSLAPWEEEALEAAWMKVGAEMQKARGSVKAISHTKQQPPSQQQEEQQQPTQQQQAPQEEAVEEVQPQGASSVSSGDWHKHLTKGLRGWLTPGGAFQAIPPHVHHDEYAKEHFGITDATDSRQLLDTIKAGYIRVVQEGDIVYFECHSSKMNDVIRWAEGHLDPQKVKWLSIHLVSNDGKKLTDFKEVTRAFGDQHKTLKRLPSRSYLIQSTKSQVHPLAVQAIGELKNALTAMVQRLLHESDDKQQYNQLLQRLHKVLLRLPDDVAGTLAATWDLFKAHPPDENVQKALNKLQTFIPGRSGQNSLPVQQVKELPSGALLVGGSTPEEEPPHEFSSTQFNLDECGYNRTQGSPLPKLQELQDAIPEEDLAADGKEKTFHITAKYGLTTDDPEEVRRVVKEWLLTRDGLPGRMSVNAALGNVSLFSSPEHDVVKVDVESEDLRSLNAFLSSHLQCTDTHPTSSPHVTLAYVKNGLGARYVGETLSTHQIILHRLTFSNKRRQETIIDLWEEGKTSGQKTLSVRQETDDKWWVIGSNAYHIGFRDGPYDTLEHARDAMGRVYRMPHQDIEEMDPFDASHTTRRNYVTDNHRAWNDGTVVKLAHHIINNRAWHDMPLLADALEEAGCTDRHVLGLLRTSNPTACADACATNSHGSSARDLVQAIVNGKSLDPTSCPHCGSSVKALTDGQKGWRCSQPPCEWSIFSAGGQQGEDVDRYTRSPATNQDAWEKAGGKRERDEQGKSLITEQEVREVGNRLVKKVADQWYRPDGSPKTRAMTQSMILDTMEKYDLPLRVAAELLEKARQFYDSEPVVGGSEAYWNVVKHMEEQQKGLEHTHVDGHPAVLQNGNIFGLPDIKHPTPPRDPAEPHGDSMPPTIKELPSGSFLVKSSPQGDILSKLKKVVESFQDIEGLGVDYNKLFYHPEKQECWWVSNDSDEGDVVKEIIKRLESVVGKGKVRVEAESSPKEDGWEEVDTSRQAVKYLPSGSILVKSNSTQKKKQPSFLCRHAGKIAAGIGGAALLTGGALAAHHYIRNRKPPTPTNPSHGAWSTEQHNALQDLAAAERRRDEPDEKPQKGRDGNMGPKRPKRPPRGPKKKAMSWLNNNSGGALVPPAQQGKPLPLMRQRDNRGSLFGPHGGGPDRILLKGYATKAMKPPWSPLILSCVQYFRDEAGRMLLVAREINQPAPQLIQNMRLLVSRLNNANRTKDAALCVRLGEELERVERAISTRSNQLDIDGIHFYLERLRMAIRLAPTAWWNDGAVVKAARSIFDHQAWNETPMLADMMEEAGCTDAMLLDALRHAPLPDENLPGRTPLSRGAATNRICNLKSFGVPHSKALTPHPEYDPDLTGDEFNYLKVLGPTHNSTPRVPFWRCRCGCGREAVFSTTTLINHRAGSCGCLRSGARPWNTERNLAIVRDFQRGSKPLAIAVRYGLTSQAVYRILKDMSEKSFPHNIKSGRQSEHRNSQTERDRLFHENSRLAPAWLMRATKLRQGSEEFEDALQSVYTGLLLAAERYDPAQGAAFSTYAEFWMKSAYQQWQQTTGVIKIPRRATTHDSAMPLKDQEAAAFAREVLLSLDQRASTGELVREQSISPPPAGTRMDLQAAMQNLSPEERQWVDLFVLQGRRQVDIAKQIGVSRATINMRLKRALEKLRAVLEKGGYGKNLLQWVRKHLTSQNKAHPDAYHAVLMLKGAVPRLIEKFRHNEHHDTFGGYEAMLSKLLRLETAVKNLKEGDVRGAVRLGARLLELYPEVSVNDAVVSLEKLQGNLSRYRQNSLGGVRVKALGDDLQRVREDGARLAQKVVRLGKLLTTRAAIGSTKAGVLYTQLQAFWTEDTQDADDVERLATWLRSVRAADLTAPQDKTYQVLEILHHYNRPMPLREFCSGGGCTDTLATALGNGWVVKAPSNWSPSSGTEYTGMLYSITSGGLQHLSTRSQDPTRAVKDLVLECLVLAGKFKQGYQALGRKQQQEDERNRALQQQRREQGTPSLQDREEEQEVQDLHTVHRGDEHLDFEQNQLEGMRRMLSRGWQPSRQVDAESLRRLTQLGYHYSTTTQRWEKRSLPSSLVNTKARSRPRPNPLVVQAIAQLEAAVYDVAQWLNGYHTETASRLDDRVFLASAVTFMQRLHRLSQLGNGQEALLRWQPFKRDLQELADRWEGQSLIRHIVRVEEAASQLQRTLQLQKASYWNDAAIVKMAQAMVSSEDYSNAPLLADALEEAGVTDVQLLGILRSPQQSGHWSHALMNAIRQAAVGHVSGLKSLQRTGQKNIIYWNDGAILKMVNQIINNRQWDLCPLLADALEEAGVEIASDVPHDANALHALRGKDISMRRTVCHVIRDMIQNHLRQQGGKSWSGYNNRVGQMKQDLRLLSNTLRGAGGKLGGMAADLVTYDPVSGGRQLQNTLEEVGKRQEDLKPKTRGLSEGLLRLRHIADGAGKTHGKSYQVKMQMTPQQWKQAETLVICLQLTMIRAIENVASDLGATNHSHPDDIHHGEPRYPHLLRNFSKLNDMAVQCNHLVGRPQQGRTYQTASTLEQAIRAGQEFIRLLRQAYSNEDDWSYRNDYVTPVQAALDNILELHWIVSASSLRQQSAWNNATPQKIAQRILHEENWGLLPILADALEEAGNTDEGVLGLFRMRSRRDADWERVRHAVGVIAGSH